MKTVAFSMKTVAFSMKTVAFCRICRRFNLLGH
jgi:hypothetical protein